MKYSYHRHCCEPSIWPVLMILRCESRKDFQVNMNFLLLRYLGLQGDWKLPRTHKTEICCSTSSYVGSCNGQRRITRTHNQHIMLFTWPIKIKSRWSEIEF